MLKATKRNFLLAIFLFGFSCQSFADSNAFKTGEIITYNIQQMGMKMGEATLEFKGNAVIEGKDSLLIIFTSKAFNFYVSWDGAIIQCQFKMKIRYVLVIAHRKQVSCAYVIPLFGNKFLFTQRCQIPFTPVEITHASVLCINHCKTNRRIFVRVIARYIYFGRKLNIEVAIARTNILRFVLQ